MRLTKYAITKVRLSGQTASGRLKSTRLSRSRGHVVRKLEWKRELPHVRQAQLQQANIGVSPHLLQAKKSCINAQPIALLKAWRCLSAALFAGALASPVAAELNIPQFSEEQVTLKPHQSSGGGGTAYKYYLGLGGGLSHIDPDGESNGFSSDDTSSAGAKVFFGKYFLPKWRWEVGYTDAGEVGFRDPNGVAGDNPTADHRIPSLAIDYLFREPSSKLNFYLRGGAALLQYDSDDSRVQFDDDNEVGALLGAGLQWRLSDMVEARLALETYGSDSAFASLSLATRLGRGGSKPLEPVTGTTSVTPVVASEAPKNEAPATDTEVGQNAATDHSSLCKSVDRELSGVSFDVGSAVLSADSKRILDRVAVALKQGPNIRVTVRGFTDSQGDAHKNQLLSQKRAQAVGRYLMMAVGNFNNPPRAIGMGESSPIASNDTASGRAKNRRIELNLKAGEGCETASIIEEVDDKTRISAEHSNQSTFQSQVPPRAVALEVPEVVPGSSVSASYGADQQACRVINRAIKDLHFETGEHQLNDGSKRALTPILTALRNDSSLRIQVTGHTDSVGRRGANQLLSEQRARSVANYLMIQAPDVAVPASYVGLGEMAPLQSNSTPEGRAANRRIEIAMTGGRNCHLPVDQSASLFAPTNPVTTHRTTQPVKKIAPQQNKPLAEVAVAPSKVAELNAPEAHALVVEQLRGQAEVDIELLPEAEDHALTREEANDLEEIVATESETVIESETVPMVQPLEQEPENTTVTMVSPVAEPALSDTIDLGHGVQPMASAQSCSVVSRVISGVQFSGGEAVLDQKARRALDPVVQLLLRDQAISVTVEAHTDNTGTVRQNMDLSERRAKAVAAYLAGGAGMIKNAPQAFGYGESRPMYDNNTAEGRRANRRVVLKLDGGRSCLSDELVAAIPGFEIEAAVLPTQPEALPTSRALSTENTLKESFVDVVGRMSRGHGICGTEAHVIDNISFDSGDHRLDIEDQRALMPLVTLWRENPRLNIEVMGHTDDAGSARNNRRLSQRRAQSVAQFLMFEAGLVENGVVATGLGESVPRAPNTTVEGRKLNRRIEVLVSGGHKCDEVAAFAPATTFTAPEIIEVEAEVEEAADVEIAAVEVSDQEVLEQEIAALVQVDVASAVQEVAPAVQTISGGGSAANEALLTCGETELMHTDVNFDTGAYFLNDQSRQALSAVVDVLLADPQMQVEVQGHTDNVGTEKRNLTLSERRAEAVAQYLLHATNNPSNPPIAVGYGADNPLADNDEADGRAQNRRIDILLSGNPDCLTAANDTDNELLEEDSGNEWELPALQMAQLGDHTRRPEQCVALQRVVEDLNFEPAGFRLNARAKNALAPVVDTLLKDPSVMVEVYGYSADYGNSSFDHVLAERRAEAVADYLMVKSGNFDNLPVAVGFGDLGGGASVDSGDSLYRANRIELRLSKGANCEQSVTDSVNIRRPIHRMQTAQVVTEEASSIQGGGGEKPVTAALLATNDSCEAHSRVLDSVAFEAGSYHLDDSSKEALNQVAESLVEHPELSYEVHGHTDARGEERANIALSEWRARSVADYLARATDQWPNVANAEGFGESRPLASNDTISGRSINRRIELQLVNNHCQ